MIASNRKPEKMYRKARRLLLACTVFRVHEERKERKKHQTKIQKTVLKAADSR